MFDYFYGTQAEQFSFYRIPKVLFTKDQFKYLSAEAKTLYGIMLDKLDLSIKNNWVNDRGRVYIIYTIEQIIADLNCGNKKAGLIERRCQGLGKPNPIFVKNFISIVDKSVERHFKKCPNDTSGSVETTALEMSERHGINTNHNNTDNNDTNPILSGCDGDRIRERRALEEYFRDSLYPDLMIQNNPADRGYS